MTKAKAARLVSLGVLLLVLFVSLLVLQGNHPPAAEGASVQTAEDTPLVIRLRASGADGDSLTWVIDTQPSHGVLTGSGSELGYAPAAGSSGDTILISAQGLDGVGGAGYATVGDRYGVPGIPVDLIKDPKREEGEGKAGLERLLNKTGVFSMSEKNDDILMWSHYADGHKGICVEFQITDRSPEYVLPDRVTYQDRLPEINAYKTSDKEKVRRLLYTKARHWEYEKEWRIVNMHTRLGVQRFPEGLLTGVIMGCDISKESRDLVLDMIGHHCCPVRLRHARRSPDRFALDVVAT